jgi:cell division protein FtsI (penicillin-binding protein 3)
MSLAGVKIKPAVQVRSDGGVVIASGEKVAVPYFAGVGLRTAIEQAGALGLRVQPVGSGLAREQVPAAGTMVPAGTEVVVRFSRSSLGRRVAFRHTKKLTPYIGC